MSTNVSKHKRTDLTEKIKKIHKYISEAKPDENTRNLLTWLSEIEKEINSKKFGLVFEEHRETIDEILETHTPVLTENKKLFIDNGGQINFLIEGDNLSALQLLLKTHKGKIDVIYIDPPYNTGAKDWKYDNDYADSNDLFRHSKWISFVKSRLILAKNLLTKDGVICVTIDDYEIGTLRLLLDEIFNEDNRLGLVTIMHNPRGRSDDKWFATSHEYALFYAKNKEFAKTNKIGLTDEQAEAFNLSDDVSFYRLLPLKRTGSNSTPNERPKLFFPIYINKQTLELSVKEQNNKQWAAVFPKDENGGERCWRWGKDKINNEWETEIVVKRKEDKFSLFTKDRIKDGRKPKTVWVDPKFDASSHGTVLLEKILDRRKSFNYPKSLYALIDTLFIMTSPNAVVLDFFAGSGTTGHAVMELNKDDNGNRKFILCTNNENDICREVTYERLKTVITGKRKDRSKYSEGAKASLKYYKIDYIPISDKLYYEYADELLEHIRELVELENAINFTGNDKIAIVLTDDEMDDFVINIKKYKNCKKLYRAHNVLVSGRQAEALKSAKIKTIAIPDYYYGELYV